MDHYRIRLATASERATTRQAPAADPTAGWLLPLDVLSAISECFDSPRDVYAMARCSSSLWAILERVMWEKEVLWNFPHANRASDGRGDISEAQAFDTNIVDFCEHGYLSGKSAIAWAVTRGDMEVVRRAIAAAQKLNPSYLDGLGHDLEITLQDAEDDESPPITDTVPSPLHLAAYLGNIAMAELLLDAGCQVNIYWVGCRWLREIGEANGHFAHRNELCTSVGNHMGCPGVHPPHVPHHLHQRSASACATPLILAISLGHVDMIRFLLQRGALMPSSYYSAFHILLQHCEKHSIDFPAVAAVLTEYGEDINNVPSFNFRPILHRAIARGLSLGTWQTLLDCGADINEVYRNRTVLVTLLGRLRSKRHTDFEPPQHGRHPIAELPRLSDDDVVARARILVERGANFWTAHPDTRLPAMVWAAWTPSATRVYEIMRKQQSSYEHWAGWEIVATVGVAFHMLGIKPTEADAARSYVQPRTLGWRGLSPGVDALDEFSEFSSRPTCDCNLVENLAGMYVDERGNPAMQGGCGWCQYWLRLVRRRFIVFQNESLD